MSDLVTWLRARLDEDEAVAREVVDLMPATWQIGSADARVAHAVTALAVKFNHGRVLAEVEAKRRILELHAPCVDGRDRAVCEYCSSLCHSRTGLMCDDPDAPYPCDTLRLLAIAYADQPRYQEEWRP